MTLSVPERAKVSAKRYVELLLPRLKNASCLLPSGFISRQDDAPAHTTKLAQDWIATNCSDFVGKSEWLPNSPEVIPLDYYVWGVMLEHYKAFFIQSQRTDGLKKVLQLIQTSCCRT